MSIETNLVCKSVNDKFSCLLLAQDSFAVLRANKACIPIMY